MSSSECEKKSIEIFNRSTQTYITNEDFIKISLHQHPMSNEEFLNMFYNRKVNADSNEKIHSFINAKNSNKCSHYTSV